MKIIRRKTTKKRTPCRNTAFVLSSPRDDGVRKVRNFTCGWIAGHPRVKGEAEAERKTQKSTVVS
jgi:hypothetical protein